MTIPRSAAFMRSLVELAGKQATVQRAIRDAATVHVFEQENKAALEEAFTRIAAAARGGAVRMMLAKDDVLNSPEFQAYMRQKGFIYTNSWHSELPAIEWWYEEKSTPQRIAGMLPNTKQLK
jgi:hypothetical protein